MTFIASELKQTFDDDSLFSQVSVLEGEVFRDVAGRRTFRFLLDGNAYFAKVHFGVGWQEIIKNLLQLRLPVLGASNEWRAIQKLEALNIETLKAMAYTSQGINPAKINSCIVTQALDETLSLEDVVLQNKLTVNLKRQLIVRLAQTSRSLHQNGVNHRDYYLCHFLLSKDSLATNNLQHLHLIDLHRVQIRQGSTPRRWLEKDLAGLLFSAADAGLTQRDVLRFMRIYSDCPLRETLITDAKLWRQILSKAARLYVKDHGQPSDLLTNLASRLTGNQ